MSWLRTRPLATLLALGALVSFSGLGHELWTPDEPRVAAIGRAMWQAWSAGEGWAMPRLAGEPFLEKPPLYWWAQAALFAAAGEASAPLARLTSALFAFGSALLTYALGRRFFPPEACAAAGLTLLTTAQLLSDAHWVLVDSALLFCVTASLVGFVHGESSQGAQRGLLFALGWLGLLGAFLAKGVVGLGIPVLGLATWLLWTGRLRGFLGPHLLLGGAALAAGIGLWLWRLRVEGGQEALTTFVVYNQLGRFLPGLVEYGGGHQKPFWYYFVNAPLLWLPWTPFAVLAALWGRRLEEGPVRDGLRLCLAGTAPVLLVLSIAGTKRMLYLDPLLPLYALAVGAWMAQAAEGVGWRRHLERVWTGVLAALAGLSLLAMVPALGAGVSPLPGVLLLGGLAFSLWRWPPRGPAERRFAVAAGACVLAAHLLLCMLPWLDERKSFAPFVEAFERSVPAGPVYALDPDETVRGVVSFYTGRDLRIIDLERLEELAAAASPSFVVVRDRKPEGKRYRSVAERDVPHRLLAESLIGSRRTLRILEVGGAEEDRGPGG